MNRAWSFVAVVVAAFTPMVGHAGAVEFMRLPDLQRVAENTYKSGEHLIITRYCYERMRGDAVLKYVGPGEYSGNRVYFRGGNHCEVKAVYDRPRSSGKCNSRTGNTALDMLNNAQCRDIEAQKFNQANAARADRMQRQLDADKAALARSRAAHQQRFVQMQAEARRAKAEADAIARQNAQLSALLSEFRKRSDAIAKIKNPSYRAKEYEKLRKDFAVARARLTREMR